MVQVLAVMLGVSLSALFVIARRAAAERRRFAAIVDVDQEIASLRAAAARNIASLQRAAAEEACALRADARRERADAACEADIIRRTARFSRRSPSHADV